MVESAAYNDPISAAVFNPAVWALPGNEALDLVCRRYLEDIVSRGPYASSATSDRMKK